MVAALAGWSVALAVLGLGFYVAHRTRPNSVRLRTSVLRVFTFSLEIDSEDSARSLAGPVQQMAGSAGSESGTTGSAQCRAVHASDTRDPRT